MQLQKGKWERSEMADASLHENPPASAFYLPALGLIPQVLPISEHNALSSLRVRAVANESVVFQTTGFDQSFL